MFCKILSVTLNQIGLFQDSELKTSFLNTKRFLINDGVSVGSVSKKTWPNFLALYPTAVKKKDNKSNPLEQKRQMTRFFNASRVVQDDKLFHCLSKQIYQSVTVASRVGQYSAQ